MDTHIHNAIKDKAEERYPDRTDPILFSLMETSRQAYTCGGEDAIGFTLKHLCLWRNLKNVSRTTDAAKQRTEDEHLRTVRRHNTNAVLVAVRLL